ncbi:MAG: hypothetical protein HYV40_05500 [Candidatus Levybacteria bacterium]|nr:hypothetical protein [Candidatus Levybacteria bacterium]
MDKIVFFVLLLFLSSNAYYLAFLPIVLPSSILNGSPDDFFRLIAFLLPLLSSIALYQVMRKVKTQKSFFLLSLLIFLIAYGVPFLNTILDIRAIEEMAVYFLFVVFFAFCASVLWKKIILKKQFSKRSLLLLPIFLIVLLEVGQIDVRSIVADYLNSKTNYNFNIYFYDVGGFAVLFYNSIITISSLLHVALLNLYAKHKK